MAKSSIEDKIVEKGAKYFFLHATGLTLPYLGYKVWQAVEKNKVKAGTVGAAAIIGAAAALLTDGDADIDDTIS